MTPEQSKIIELKIEIMFLRYYLKQCLPYLRSLGMLDEPSRVFTPKIHELIGKITSRLEKTSEN